MFRCGGTPPGLSNAANVAIIGGTIAGVTGVPVILASGGIPFIGLATSTMTTGGIITVGTALPAVYPSAYCYFPANKIATVSAAGFYYCTFSTTTAGVAFQNAYVSGIPTIPTSPTACTTAGNFTGDTGEEFGLTVTIPAMTATSAIRLLIGTQETNNANAKTLNVRMSGNAGTIFFSHLPTSVAASGVTLTISNTGASNRQITQEHGGFGANVSAVGTLGTVDLSLGTATMVFSLTRGTATDNFVLLPATVEVVQ